MNDDARATPGWLLTWQRARGCVPITTRPNARALVTCVAAAVAVAAVVAAVVATVGTDRPRPHAGHDETVAALVAAWSADPDLPAGELVTYAQQPDRYLWRNPDGPTPPAYVITPAQTFNVIDPSQVEVVTWRPRGQPSCDRVRVDGDTGTADVVACPPPAVGS